MKKNLIIPAICLIVATVAVAQKQPRPWKEWNRKEAEKIFNDSAWSHSQTETASSQSADVSTNFGDTRGREEAVRNVSTGSSVTLHVRFFSAKPIRQAYVRMLETADTPPDAALIEKMEAWANLPADERIIVALAYTGDQRAAAKIAGALRRATTEDLKSVFLERNDGKRVALAEYTPPGKDAFGARFIFPRTVDGRPFLNADAGTIRFHIEYAPNMTAASAAPQTNSRGATSPVDSYKLKLDMKFKVTEMMYGDALEY
jgi:hypothetical protein